jgi:1-acyl-sn-glycerol-3-phosphate acyltransferase
MTFGDWRDEFADIRPYSDEELKTVLRRISRNRWLVSGIRRMRMPACPEYLKPFVHRFIEFDLWRILRKVASVDDFQRRIIVEKVLEYLVRKTSDGLTWSGTDRLKRGGAYLFISNHRDIVLDSALLNYALAESDLDIAEIAFGDNLLANDFVSDLIRVNKSFIVRRNLPIREKIRAARNLSKYIRMTRLHGNSVWIAQREGRAKDGNDSTNPSILKMLAFSAKLEGIDFASFVREMPIVPVAVSYEYDPCDRYKARELHRTRKSGAYEKRKSEDLMSMYAGLKGQKGRMHVSFGEPIVCDSGDVRDAAADIDRQIHCLYRLRPSNYIAYDLLHQSKRFSDRYDEVAVSGFRERLRKESPGVFEIVCEIYAKAVENALLCVEPRE